MFKTFSMSSRMGRDLQRYNEGCRQVVGCIPYRYRETNESSFNNGARIDDLEFLLISSQKSPRVMFPKEVTGSSHENSLLQKCRGGWEIDESLKDAALRETFEEAGVLGEVEVQDYLGTWSFKSKSQGTFHEGHMLPLLVTEELDDWPEKTARRRFWMKFNEAREVCWHPWMKEALDVFASKLANRNKEEPQTSCPFEELPDKTMTNIDTEVANQMYNDETRMEAEVNPLTREEPSINPVFDDEQIISTVADSMLNETLFSEELGISHVAAPMFNESKRISIIAHS
ncbi:nudix hydrolase 17, mitochondrial-like isoform X1 [Nicotiana tomentosiformis]|uniref:nudix hydrolase 17, mitochondrial-like isoform X1 n=1 Tax=Nicotiana tomentosiformis TaxID=4098 RepID=UPI00051B3935|nr:nudix hydrolase 17, mitochondrial-like isoform X1 [Nicotiana tomentosiformis]